MNPRRLPSSTPALILPVGSKRSIDSLSNSPSTRRLLCQGYFGEPTVDLEQAAPRIHGLCISTSSHPTSSRQSRRHERDRLRPHDLGTVGPAKAIADALAARMTQ